MQFLRRASRMSFRYVLSVSLLLCAPTRVSAQQSVQEVLSLLLTNQAVATGDFVKDAEATAAARDTITRALAIELATLPVSPSSAGFTYRFNPLLGTVERSTYGFGGFFIERALTSGRHRGLVGVNVRHTRFTHLDDRRLRDGSFVTTANRFTDEPAPFDVETLSLEFSATTVTAYGTYGITDRLDVGILLPMTRLQLDGERINTYRGEQFRQASASVVRSGPSDLAARAKYLVVSGVRSALAVATELRFPTGSRDQLTGAGEAAYSGVVIASTERGPVGMSGMVGVSGGGLSQTATYGGSVSWSVGSRATVVGEMAARRIDVGEIALSAAAHPTIVGVETIRLTSNRRARTTATGSIGLKWNVHSEWLVTGNLVVPLSRRGLTSAVTPIIALERSFGGN